MLAEPMSPVRALLTHVSADRVCVVRVPRAGGLGARRTKEGADRAAPFQCGARDARSRCAPWALYGWKSAPKAPRIGPRVSPTPNASPVRPQLPMIPSGPSASWPTNIPSSWEASAAMSPASTLM